MNTWTSRDSSAWTLGTDWNSFTSRARCLISFDAWPEGNVHPTTHQITVLAPKPGPKPEPVTERLLKTLPHPDRQATVGDVRFSADCKRLMMAGFADVSVMAGAPQAVAAGLRASR